MARTLSLTFREANHAQETGEVPVVLLTIAHPTLPTPKRISSDPTTRYSDDEPLYKTVSRGNDYLFMPFGITLPEDSNESPPTAQLVIDNVMREHIALVRSISTAPTILIEIVLASSPDTVEISFPVFNMSKVDYTANSMTITLTLDPLVLEPFPAHSFDPSTFPGLHL